MLRRRRAFFPPQSQLLLHRPVGEAEQHRFAGGAVAVRMPAWHHEDVARLPAEAVSPMIVSPSPSTATNTVPSVQR